MSTIWRALDRLQLTVKKPSTPTSHADLTSSRPDGSGKQGCRFRDARQYVFLDECGVTTDLLRRYSRSLRGTRLPYLADAAIGRRTL